MLTYMFKIKSHIISLPILVTLMGFMLWVMSEEDVFKILHKGNIEIFCYTRYWFCDGAILKIFKDHKYHLPQDLIDSKPLSCNAAA